MATNTFTPIQTYTVSGTSTTYLDFSSISGYTDLFLEANYTPSTTTAIRVRFNGDASSIYGQTELYTNGSSPASASGTDQTGIYLGDARSGQINTILVNFQNYAVTTNDKITLSTNSNQNYAEKIVGRWGSIAPITSIRLYLESGYFTAGSQFTLYGIANAELGAAKAKGGIITYDNNYYYHTFGTSGTFTPQQSLTADVLVIAGGGGGGCDKAGGGGAGGLAFQTGRSLSATGYSITVGAGGAGVSSNGVKGVSGGNSVFDTITALGGGGGGSENNIDGANGGSAGGGCRAGIGGTATQGSSGGATGFGNNGGNGNNGTNSIYAGGGGGGAGSTGANAPTSGTVMASGGNGVNTYSSWLSIIGQGVNGYIAAGGGSGGYGPTTLTGGSGGLGGGGNGGGYNPDTAGTSAIVNTGSGGGGGGNGLAGGNGASGLVVVRYLKA